MGYSSKGSLAGGSGRAEEESAAEIRVEGHDLACATDRTEKGNVRTLRDLKVSKLLLRDHKCLQGMALRRQCFKQAKAGTACLLPPSSREDTRLALTRSQEGGNQQLSVALPEN